MNEKHIKEVFSDEAFVKSLLELETPAQVQMALQGNGIDMSESEIVSLRDEIIKQVQKISESGELSVDQLDEAAGGNPFAVLGAVGLVATAVISMGVAAGGIGVIGGGITAGIIGIGALISNRRW